MKVFKCGNCKHPLYFENTYCENCGRQAGYRDSDRQMLTFAPEQSLLVSDREAIAYRYCENKAFEVCNWLIPADSEAQFCSACQLNRTIPYLSNTKNFDKWRNLEVAKHRLIYQLQKLGLPLPSKHQNRNEGLCFDFVARRNNPNIMTGHANGIITILLSEADSTIREKRRKELLEPYRTLIGHLRHEVGHYFWERLIHTDEDVLNEYRLIFGDERMSYADALALYYQNGAASNWEENHISRYATAHSWEDWAETWAHYLHIMDMVETAYFFRLKVDLETDMPDLNNQVSFDPYTIEDFDKIIQTSVPLSFAVNSINRAMGHQDVYPFVISPKVVEKLKFIHQLLLRKRDVAAS